VQIATTALFDRYCCLVGTELRLSTHNVNTNGRNREKNIVANVKDFVREELNKYFW
jgi:hypothetical protein